MRLDDWARQMRALLDRLEDAPDAVVCRVPTGNLAVTLPDDDEYAGFIDVLHPDESELP